MKSCGVTIAIALTVGCIWPRTGSLCSSAHKALREHDVGADDGDVLPALDENTQEGISAEEIADVTVLRARVKHLELQQGLMGGELESMSDLARQTDTQLRCAMSEQIERKRYGSLGWTQERQQSVLALNWFRTRLSRLM